MALWICNTCTAAYAVGLRACPQCGATEHEEDSTMPKISKGDGATYEPGQNPAGTEQPTPADAAPQAAIAAAPEPETAAPPEPEVAPKTPPAAPGKA